MAVGIEQILYLLLNLMDIALVIQVNLLPEYFQSLSGRIAPGAGCLGASDSIILYLHQHTLDAASPLHGNGHLNGADAFFGSDAVFDSILAIGMKEHCGQLGRGVHERVYMNPELQAVAVAQLLQPQDSP